MGGNTRNPSGRLRLGPLVLVAVLFALIPVARASADFKLDITIVGEGEVLCEVEIALEECEAEYPEKTEVSLEPIEEVGYEFKEFAGDCSGKECALTMNADREVTAIFVLEGAHLLSVSTDGTGSGHVECELEEGPKPCAGEYLEEPEVTLVPVADEGSQFAGFSGDCSGTECALTMNEDHQVTATFVSEESGGGGGGAPSGSTSPQVVVEHSLGKAHVAGAALYRGGTAMLRLICKGPGPCRGTVKLFAKLKRDTGEARRTQIAKVGFSLPAGRSKTVKVNLLPAVKRLLGKGRTIIAKVGGPGVAGSKLRIRPTAR